CLFAGAAWSQPTCPAPGDPMPVDAAKLTWDRPTQYTDGQSIPFTTQLRYTLYRQSGTSWTAVSTTTQREASQESLSPGETCWSVTARVGTGPESDRSNVACKTYVQVPNPPGNLTVAQNLTAYTLIQTRNNLAAVAVGAVASGTACLSEGIIA